MRNITTSRNSSPIHSLLGYLMLMAIILLYSQFNAAVQISAFICFCFVLASNEFINEDNFGKMAIAHIISTFLMIGGYEHFSGHIRRDVLFLNMGAAGFLSAFTVGFTLWIWRKLKQRPWFHQLISADNTASIQYRALKLLHAAHPHLMRHYLNRLTLVLTERHGHSTHLRFQNLLVQYSRCSHHSVKWKTIATMKCTLQIQAVQPYTVFPDTRNESIYLRLEPPVIPCASQAALHNHLSMYHPQEYLVN